MTLLIQLLTFWPEEETLYQLMYQLPKFVLHHIVLKKAASCSREETVSTSQSAAYACLNNVKVIMK